jgi:hypothetical protein
LSRKYNFFFKKILYVIPSALLSFLPYYCHSFRIIVIPSVLLSFLLDYCHSFHITVIPSKLLSLPFQIFVILNSCTLKEVCNRGVACSLLKLGSLKKTVIASLFHSGLHSGTIFLWKKRCHMSF